MSTVFTPNFTDNVSIISAAVLARGSVSRTTYDLRTKRGAWFFVRIGRGGTTAITTTPITAIIRRTLNNAGIINPSPDATYVAQLTAASSTTVNSDSNSGQSAVNVASSAGFAAGDIVCIQDSGGGVTWLEWGRVSKVAAGVITLDSPLQYTHTSAAADTVRNKGEAWAGWVDGGATYEILIDYGSAGAGESITIEVKAQTYDTDTGA